MSGFCCVGDQLEMVIPELGYYPSRSEERRAIACGTHFHRSAEYFCGLQHDSLGNAGRKRYAMDAISKAGVASSRPTVYLHRAGPDLHDTRGEKLIAATSASANVVDIKYPAADGERLANVDDEVGLEKTPAHDARLGSLVQCDAVLLLGGTSAPRHLIQLMAFLQERRLRAARPILFVPLPWAGGIAERAFRVFDGVIENTDPVSLV